MGNILMEEYPVYFQASLAVVLGLEHAVFIQQIATLQSRYSEHVHDVIKDGEWIYLDRERWNKLFPFWSESEIQSMVDNMKKMDFLIVDGEFKKSLNDKGKRYKLNEEVIDKFIDNRIEEGIFE